MKKVLIITYYWPPAGGPGVQRVLKFAKYLPEFGWQPVILTVQKGEYPAYDESLLEDIPAGCRVYRTRSLEPGQAYKKFTGMNAADHIPVSVLTTGKTSWKDRLAHWIRLNLFVPDAKIGWMPFAVKEGKKIIRREKPDIIFSSSPPPTVHLIARKLAKWSKLKWVADFRDPWTRIHYYQKRFLPILGLDRMLEKKVITGCTGAISASPSFIKLLTSESAEKFAVITNGYDQEINIPETGGNDKFRLVYMGGLPPSRYYEKFYLDLRILLDQNRISAQKMELLFIGIVEESIKTEIKRIFHNYDIVHFPGYIPHKKALTEYVAKADCLLLFLENNIDYSGHIPGKIFEYMAFGRFILGIGDQQGDAAEILRTTDSGIIYRPETDFTEILFELYDRWQNNRVHQPDRAEISKYSRKKLTEQLAQILEDCSEEV